MSRESSDEKFGWGSAFVRWRELVPLLGTLSIIAAGLYSWIYAVHAATPHHGAAEIDDINKLDKRIDRVEQRMEPRLQRIEDKLDVILRREN